MKQRPLGSGFPRNRAYTHVYWHLCCTFLSAVQFRAIVWTCLGKLIGVCDVDENNHEPRVDGSRGPKVYVVCGPYRAKNIYDNASTLLSTQQYECLLNYCVRKPRVICACIFYAHCNRQNLYSAIAGHVNSAGKPSMPSIALQACKIRYQARCCLAL